jgi:hypothetical protein
METISRQSLLFIISLAYHVITTGAKSNLDMDARTSASGKAMGMGEESYLDFFSLFGQNKNLSVRLYQ